MIKAYVINLDKDVNRLEKFHQSINLDVERFAAISSIDDDKNIFPVNVMSKGEMCCALSHIKLWKKLVKDREYDMYLIFEDDARSYGDVEKYLTEFMDMGIPFDVLYLGKCYDQCSKLESTEYEHVYKSYRPLCTHAYVITKEYAKKLLDTWVYTAIDFHINSGNGNFLAFHPSLVYQETISLSSTLSNSSIAARRHVNDCTSMDSEIVSTKIKSNNFYIFITVVVIIILILILLWVKREHIIG